MSSSLDSESEGTSYASDELVREETSYYCPLCGNESYGDYHSDCFSRCAECSKWFASDKVINMEDERHHWFDEFLCIRCYKKAMSELELIELKEPDE